MNFLLDILLEYLKKCYNLNIYCNQLKGANKEENDKINSLPWNPEVNSGKTSQLRLQ